MALKPFYTDEAEVPEPLREHYAADDNGRHVLEVVAGDVIAFPVGLRGAHEFRNDSAADCQMFALGEHVPHEVAENIPIPKRSTSSSSATADR